MGGVWWGRRDNTAGDRDSCGDVQLDADRHGERGQQDFHSHTDGQLRGIAGAADSGDGEFKIPDSKWMGIDY